MDTRRIIIPENNSLKGGIRLNDTAARAAGKLALLLILALCISMFFIPGAMAAEDVQPDDLRDMTKCEFLEHQHTAECFGPEGDLICSIPEHSHTEECYLLDAEGNSNIGKPEEPEMKQQEYVLDMLTFRKSAVASPILLASSDVKAVNHSAVTKVTYGSTKEPGNYYVLAPNANTTSEWWFDGGYSSGSCAKISSYTSSGGGFVENYAKITNDNMSGHIGRWIKNVGTIDGRSIDIKETYTWNPLTLPCINGASSTSLGGTFTSSSSYHVPVSVGVTTWYNASDPSTSMIAHRVTVHAYSVKTEIFYSDNHSSRANINVALTLGDVDCGQAYGLKLYNGNVDQIRAVSSSNSDTNCEVYLANEGGYWWSYTLWDYGSDTGFASDDRPNSEIRFLLGNTNAFEIVYSTGDDPYSYKNYFSHMAMNTAWASQGRYLSNGSFRYYSSQEEYYGTNAAFFWRMWENQDTAYGNAWAYYYGYGFGPTEISTPTKAVTDANESWVTTNGVGKDETFTYYVDYYVPSERTEWRYSSFTFKDTLPGCVSYQSYSVKDADTGANLSTFFNGISQSGQTLTITAKTNTNSGVNAAGFYNRTIRFAITVKLNTSSAMTSAYRSAANEYKFTNTASITAKHTTDSSETTKNTNTVTTYYRTKPVTPEKLWSDNNDEAGLRPSSVTVQIKQGSTVVSTVTLNASNSWKATVELPKFAASAATGSGGSPELAYTVSENPVSNYTGSVSGYKITNKLEAGSVTVTKVISGSGTNSLAGFTFQLKGTSSAGGNVNKTATTNANGTATFSGIPYGTYTVSEINIPEIYDVSPASQQVTVSASNQNAKPAYSFTNTVKYGTLVVQKTSDDNQNAGISFKLTGTSKAGDSVSLTAVTDSSGKATFNNVPISSTTGYTLEEVNAPKRYYLISKVTGIAIKSGETTTISGDKVHNPITKVEILKVDDNGSPLAGATLHIENASGTKVGASWVSKTTAQTVTGLERGGTYYLVEEKEAPGYWKNPAKVSFTLGTTKDSSPTKVQMTNHITITKIQKTNASGTPISGAVLQVLDSNNRSVEQWTSDGQPHEIKGLTAGATYTLHEVTPADGYVTAADQKFQITAADGSVTSVTMKDDPTKYAFYKVDEDGAALSGAVLEVRSRNGTVIDRWTTDGSAHTIEGKLIVGQKYTLHEVSAPPNYAVADDISFTVPDSSALQKITMTNKLKRVDFTFTKTSFTKTPLAGTTFDLYYCYDQTPGHTHSTLTSTSTGCWQKFDTQTSDANGSLTFSELIATRTYALIETKATDGQQLASGYWLITYDERTGNSDTDWTVTPVGTELNMDFNARTGWHLSNPWKYDLPKAGGEGDSPYLFYGSSIMLLALSILLPIIQKIYRRRNSRT